MCPVIFVGGFKRTIEQSNYNKIIEEESKNKKVFQKKVRKERKRNIE